MELNASDTGIKLNDILGLSEDEIEDVRIRLMKRNDSGEDPLETYLTDPERVTDGWAMWHPDSKEYFRKPGTLVLAFVRKGCCEWLLVAAKRILGHSKSDPNLYEGEDDPRYAKYRGRLVMSYRNPKGAAHMVRRAGDFLGKEDDAWILREPYSGDRFPGYDKVFVSAARLKSVTARETADWKGALSSVKGVYMITDVRTGKCYVGSAYGEDGIWGRWRQYAETGHGGDVELKKLPEGYGSNFMFSILRTFPMSATDQEVLEREAFEKERRGTRKTGYNRN